MFYDNVKIYKKMRSEKLNLRELSSSDMKKIEGGVLGAFAAIGGLLYMAGEIMESAGRAYRKAYL